MLCIAVAPESRRLGKVDMFNAAMFADLVELRLDRLEKDPDLKEMMDGISKPILISCRRKEDGGAWDGSEEERMTLIRAAIVAGPAYIELEHDIADKVPRFGSTKRVVSYTQLQKPLSNLEPIIDRCIAAKADVVKLTGPTPTLDAAWPLLATVTKKRQVPVVGMGLGKPGVSFSLLGRRFGAPWIYAALEKGLEAYEGQPTISELEEIYRWRDVTPQTKFVAVTGFDDSDTLRVKLLNTAFAHLGANIRCLPLELGLSEKIGQMLDVLQCSFIVGNPRMAERMLNLASELEEDARISQYADLVMKKKDGWHALNTMWRSAVRTIETRMGGASKEDRPLDKRTVFLLGSGGAAKSVAYGVQKRKGLISITAADDNEARMLAGQFNARFVPTANMYNTLCDVVVITEGYAMDTVQSGQRADPKQGLKINPSFLRPHMIVADVTRLPMETELLEEARLRGCKMVPSRDIFVDQIASLAKLIAGGEVPHDVLQAALPEEAEEE